jgi:hypothetical protein
LDLGLPPVVDGIVANPASACKRSEFVEDLS